MELVKSFSYCVTDIISEIVYDDKQIPSEYLDTTYDFIFESMNLLFDIDNIQVKVMDDIDNDLMTDKYCYKDKLSILFQTSINNDFLKVYYKEKDLTFEQFKSLI